MKLQNRYKYKIPKIWFYEITGVQDVATLAELEIAKKLSHSRAKIFLESRGYIRKSLAELFDLDPLEVPITAKPGEPPKLPTEMGNISLSHCKDAVAIAWNRERIGIDIERKDRIFKTIDEVEKDKAKYDLVMSLDVIMHIMDMKSLIEHIDLLDKKSNRFILIYASNFSHNSNEKFYHMRSWNVTAAMSLMKPEYKQVAYQRNLLPWTRKQPENVAKASSVCDFFMYEKGRIDNNEEDRKFDP